MRKWILAVGVCMMSALVFAGCATAPSNGAASARAERVGETKVMISDEIAAIIDRPEGGRKAPAVLLLHSFASQKDEWGGLFKRLAAALSARGIASLRFDYSGWGESKGDMADSTIDRWIAEAKATYAFLLRQSFVDPKRIGLLGFSVSGGVAIVTASQNPGWFKSMVTWSSIGDFKEMLGLLGKDNMDKAARDGKVFIDLQWTKLTLKDAFFKSLFRYDIEGSIGAYPGALLAVAGSKDFSAAYVDGFVSSVMGSPKKALVVPDGDHTFHAGDKDQSMSDSVIAQTTDWFENTL